MNREKETELKIDEFIWIITIVLSILNIVGDEFEKKYLYDKDPSEKSIAKKIFNFTVFVSFLIYLYLLQKTHKKYKNAKLKNQDTDIPFIRFVATILITIGVLLLLYAQLTDKSANNPDVV